MHSQSRLISGYMCAHVADKLLKECQRSLVLSRFYIPGSRSPVAFAGSTLKALNANPTTSYMSERLPSKCPDAYVDAEDPWADKPRTPKGIQESKGFR